MILKILQQPYPFNDSDRQHLWFSVLSAIFVFGFLAIFQPFGIAKIDENIKLWYLAGFGVVSFLGTAIYFFGIQKTFTGYFQEKNWSVGREILSNLSIIFLIATGNYVYNAFLFNSLYVGGFLYMLFYTLIIGLFPVIIIVLITYINQLLKYSQPPAVVPKNDLSHAQSIKLIAENEKDFITLTQKDLLYIESSDNYSTVYFLKEEKLNKELIRSSLSRLESQLNLPTVVRCHRSYIANLQNVKSVTGNAQGYKLHLNSHDLQVPVARKYSTVVEYFK